MNDILFNYFNQQNIFARLFKFQLSKRVIITMTTHQGAVKQIIWKSVEKKKDLLICRGWGEKKESSS